MNTSRFFYCIVCVAVILVSCQKNIVTGRRSLALVPEHELDKYSLEQYKKILDTNVVLGPENENTIRVKRVGERIQRAVETIYNEKGHPEQLEDYNWEFNVIQDTILNAFCMPGGKVIVYTRLLELVENDSMLAFVMAHEISHAIARHGNTRVSQALITQMGKKSLSVSLIVAPNIVRKIVLGAFGASTGLGLLQFSRNDEKEADRMGLIFMAKAGYNPKASVEFMTKMANAANSHGFVLFRTHPSDKHRLSLMNKNIPKAMKYYAPAK